MDQKPRKTETVEMESTHRDFAGGVGKTRFVTPEESKMLVGINRGKVVTKDEIKPQQGEYLHREMVTQQRGKKGK